MGFKLESDIFTNYEGTVTEASALFSEEYGGQVKFVLDEIDGRQDPTFENYSLPPGWESADGGETITRVDGTEKGIVKSSQWGKFLAAVNDCGDEVWEVLTENAAVDMREWIGTRWRFEAVAGKPYKFTDKKTGEKVEGVSKDKNYPVAFLGKDASGSTTLTNTGTANGKVDSLSVLTTLNNPVIESQIQDLAKTLPHKEWFGQSFSLVSGIGVTAATHPDLITAMGGRGLYESLGGKG